MMFLSQLGLARNNEDILEQKRKRDQEELNENGKPVWSSEIPISSQVGIDLIEPVDSNYKRRQINAVEAFCEAKQSSNFIFTNNICKGQFSKSRYSKNKLSRSYNWPMKHFRSMSAASNFEFLNKVSILQLKPCSTVIEKLTSSHIESIKKLMKSTQLNTKEIVDVVLKTSSVRINLKRDVISQEANEPERVDVLCSGLISELKREETLSTFETINQVMIRKLKPCAPLLTNLSMRQVELINTLMKSSSMNYEAIIGLVEKTRSMSVELERLPADTKEDEGDSVIAESVLEFGNEEESSDCGHCSQTKQGRKLDRSLIMSKRSSKRITGLSHEKKK